MGDLHSENISQSCYDCVYEQYKASSMVVPGGDNECLPSHESLSSVLCWIAYSLGVSELSVNRRHIEEYGRNNTKLL